MEQEEHIHELWHNFSQNTGIHGLNKISDLSKTNAIRFLIWLCIILASSTYLTYTVITEIQMYYTYPTTFAMYTQPNIEMEFPAVTICNLNTLNKSAMKNDSRIDNYYLSMSPLGMYAESINWSDPFYEQEGFYSQRTLDDIMKENKQILNMFLFMAQFDRSSLDVSTFFKVVKYPGRPCLTSNPKMELKTTKTGSWFNLNLWLYLDKDNDYYGSSFGEGIQVIIHDPNDDVVYGTKLGHFVEPGREIFAAVTKKQLVYLSSPYEAMPNTYCQENSNDGTEYVRSKCYKECLAKLMYNACGCVDFTHENLTYCSKYDVATCHTPTLANITTYNYRELCNCPVACKSTTYEVSMSSSLFPSEFFSNELLKIGGTEDVDIYRRNFISLHIYFDQLETTVVKQVPKYETAGYIFANLGGQMGLFLGASIITITELGEFVLLAMYFLVKRLKKNRMETTKIQKIYPPK